MALLATLQHHGAATPLLDVTTDPLIALWMVAFASADEPDALDDRTGKLYAILRPPRERWIEPLDSRPYVERLSEAVSGTYFWYRAPDVTERLRIQRGSFLLGGLNTESARGDTTLHISLGSDPTHDNYVTRRLARRGERSNTARRTSEVFALKVRGSVKRELRKLLLNRSGLSVATVYPTPWHKPFIEEFSSTYSRGRRLELDI